MKYLVTGATGFIGGRVARQLLVAGHEVITLARTPSAAQDLVTLGVKVHAGDITNKESLRIPMTGVDGVFHIAAWYKIGARDMSQAEAINVGGTRNVLEMMKELGIPKGVYTSTLTVFSDTGGQMVDESYTYTGPPFLSEYDRTKWKAHYEVAKPLMQAGLPLIIVLPGLVYGPGDTSIIHQGWVNYLHRKLPILPSGTTYCWTHVDDTAHGHLLAMEQGKVGESYIIAGPKYSVLEAFTLAEQISGVPAPRLHPAPWMMKALASMIGLLDALFPLPEPYSAESIRSSAGVSYLGSNEKAQRELGYAPRTLEQGLPETLEYEMHQLGMRFQAGPIWSLQTTTSAGKVRQQKGKRMTSVNVRYQVFDVNEAIVFYTQHLGFSVEMHPGPGFARLSRGGLHLLLNAVGGSGGAAQAMPDGRRPEPGGWNRIQIEVDDLADLVERLRSDGAQFRNDIVNGNGGKQILLDDPSGNPIELFEPYRG